MSSVQKAQAIAYFAHQTKYHYFGGPQWGFIDYGRIGVKCEHFPTGEYGFSSRQNAEAVNEQVLKGLQKQEGIVEIRIVLVSKSETIVVV